MKIRTNLCAGGSGCSPETQYYMEQALAMQAKVENCMAKVPTTTPPPAAGYYPPYYGYYPPYTPPSYTGYTYPDMSGACG